MLQEPFPRFLPVLTAADKYKDDLMPVTAAASRMGPGHPSSFPAVCIFIIGSDLFSFLSIRVVLNCITIEIQTIRSTFQVSSRWSLPGNFKLYKSKCQELSISSTLNRMRCINMCENSGICTLVKNGFTILSLPSKTYFSHHICSRCPMSNATANLKGSSMHLARS